ncbi:hypothetical protein TIFTF001_039727 [Ficus carica]|uniref:Uncharacterized protein n=1 Tax=Ficus carica TaxID=3494 RepID=A0AA87YW42_FICCA|nr:hypothetical protein TIFTF001_039727 [Ficus carica]
MDQLLVLEEHYWRQWVRADWIKAGDKNTKFIYSKASQRHVKKEIDGLEDASGSWKTDDNGVGDIVEDFL